MGRAPRQRERGSVVRSTSPVGEDASTPAEVPETPETPVISEEEQEQPVEKVQSAAEPIANVIGAKGGRPRTFDPDAEVIADLKKRGVPWSNMEREFQKATGKHVAGASLETQYRRWQREQREK